MNCINCRHSEFDDGNGPLICHLDKHVCLMEDHYEYVGLTIADDKVVLCTDYVHQYEKEEHDG